MSLFPNWKRIDCFVAKGNHAVALLREVAELFFVAGLRNRGRRADRFNFFWRAFREEVREILVADDRWHAFRDGFEGKHFQHFDSIGVIVETQNFLDNAAALTLEFVFRFLRHNPVRFLKHFLVKGISDGLIIVELQRMARAKENLLHFREFDWFIILVMIWIWIVCYISESLWFLNERADHFKVENAFRERARFIEANHL